MLRCCSQCVAVLSLAIGWRSKIQSVARATRDDNGRDCDSLLSESTAIHYDIHPLFMAVVFLLVSCPQRCVGRAEPPGFSRRISIEVVDTVGS